MLDTTFLHIRRFIPKRIFNFFQPAYHWLLAFAAALLYRFPSQKITVIAVTGTKGKSSVTEILNAILEEAGHKTAVSNTIRFKIGSDSVPNLHKMSMPGRFFMQRFLSQAVLAGSEYAIIEMTSQGALLHRHLFISLDMLIFTNLSPEHIEAHGSYENYVASKLSIGKALASSNKSKRTLIANADDKESLRFLALAVSDKKTYSLADAKPFALDKGIEFTFDGTRISSALAGEFNLYNLLAAATAAKELGVSGTVIERAIKKLDRIPGRVQKIECGQGFQVIVDYAHTPDSLEKLYRVFPDQRKICVLGGTGGGRDTWKRQEMGRIADAHCGKIFLTDEDPYDEDPKKIVDDVRAGIKQNTAEIVMDRRQAIRSALKAAGSGDVVLITGKGTDPYIMGPHGTKIPWSDSAIAGEELCKLMSKEV